MTTPDGQRACVVCGAPGVKAVVVPASHAGTVSADRGATYWYCQAHLGQAKSIERTYGFSTRGTWVVLGVVVVVLLIALAVNWLIGA